MVSAVFRNTITQFSVPDSLRGRLMGVQTAVDAGGPWLGNLEAGAVATGFGDTFAVVSGGLACIVGVLAVAQLLPGFHHHRLVPPREPTNRSDQPAEFCTAEREAEDIG